MTPASIENRTLLLQNIPDFLKLKLVKVREQRYGELYEPDSEGSLLLEDALEEILESFQDGNQTLSHIRYVWMALILASVVEPTVEYYQPDNSIPKQTIAKMVSWLFKTIWKMPDPKWASTEISIPEEIDVMLETFNLSHSEKKIASFQTLTEALDVYSNAIKTLDYHQSLAALLDILEDCLEGYAVFPGAEGRRELFDWWLLDVVPACWDLLPPSSIYVVGNLSTPENIVPIPMNLLKDIMIEKLHLMTEKLQSQIMKTWDSFDNNISNDYFDNIDINRFTEKDITNTYQDIAA